MDRCRGLSPRVLFKVRLLIHVASAGSSLGSVGLFASPTVWHHCDLVSGAAFLQHTLPARPNTKNPYRYSCQLCDLSVAFPCQA